MKSTLLRLRKQPKGSSVLHCVCTSVDSLVLCILMLHFLRFLKYEEMLVI